MRLFKQYIILLLISVCLIACGDEEDRHDTLPDVPVSGIQVIKDNTLRYTVVCPVGASIGARLAASKISNALGVFTGTYIDPVSVSQGDGACEIIVDNGKYGPSKTLCKGMTYGSYMLGYKENKILVAAFDDDAFAAGAEKLCNLFEKHYKQGNLNISEELLTGGFSSDVRGYIPPLKTDVSPYCILQSGSNTTEDKAMQVEFSSCFDSDFTAYCNALVQEGYHKVCDNDFGGSCYGTYSNGQYLVNVSLYRAVRRMRIVSEPEYEKDFWSIEGSEGNEKMLMMQVYQDGVRFTGASTGGFIIRLSDGRFLIYDTGLENNTDELIEYMRSRNTFQDGKIRIALLIISHPHADHYGGFLGLAKKYSSEIQCEAVAFNLTNHKRQSCIDQASLFAYTNDFTASAKRLGARVYCLRAGETFNLAGARLEVLFTPDELGTFFLSGKNEKGEKDTTYDMNNSSIIVRLIVDGQKITLTGDCRGGEAGIFNETLLDTFESDIMSVAHHGFNVMTTVEMYRKAKPFALFWCVTKEGQDMTRAFDKTLMAASYVKKHFFQDELVEIELPYIL